jgi:Type II secretion system (T2SS), protein G
VEGLGCGADNMKTTKKRIVFYSIAVPIISLFFYNAVQTLRPAHEYSGPSNKGICYIQMMRIVVGMEQYKADFGNFPTGSVSEIFRALNENNPKHRIYVEYVGRTSKSPKWNGSFVDPWGSFYKIETQSQTNVIIYSAGINKKFGDDDDMIFDGTTKDLVKP